MAGGIEWLWTSISEPILSEGPLLHYSEWRYPAVPLYGHWSGCYGKVERAILSMARFTAPVDLSRALSVLLFPAVSGAGCRHPGILSPSTAPSMEGHCYHSRSLGVGGACFPRSRCSRSAHDGTTPCWVGTSSPVMKRLIRPRFSRAWVPRVPPGARLRGCRWSGGGGSLCHVRLGLLSEAHQEFRQVALTSLSSIHHGRGFV